MAKRAVKGRIGHRARARVVKVVREGGKLFVQIPKKGDLGPEERAAQRGGVALGLRKLENGATVDGAWAVAAEPLDYLGHVMQLGSGADRARRLEAGRAFQRTANAAGTRICVSAGYLQRVGGREGENEEAEKRQKKADKRMRRWQAMLGPRPYGLLVDLVVAQQDVPVFSRGVVVWALDRIADDLRLS